MKKLPDRELLCYSYIAFRPWNHLERAKHHWNARRVIGTIWNARSANGTARAHNLSAEREVRAGNRSCSASRGFLCARVLDA